jgi:hypothetical protein
VVVAQAVAMSAIWISIMLPSCVTSSQCPSSQFCKLPLVDGYVAGPLHNQQADVINEIEGEYYLFQQRGMEGLRCEFCNSFDGMAGTNSTWLCETHKPDHQACLACYEEHHPDDGWPGHTETEAAINSLHAMHRGDCVFNATHRIHIYLTARALDCFQIVDAV